MLQQEGDFHQNVLLPRDLSKFVLVQYDNSFVAGFNNALVNKISQGSVEGFRSRSNHS